jgi:hypothetical protein
VPQNSFLSPQLAELLQQSEGVVQLSWRLRHGTVQTPPEQRMLLPPQQSAATEQEFPEVLQQLFDTQSVVIPPPQQSPLKTQLPWRAAHSSSQAASQPSPVVVLPSSHSSPAWTMPSPHTGSLQALVHPSLLTALSSSHSSPASTAPFPQQPSSATPSQSLSRPSSHTSALGVQHSPNFAPASLTHTPLFPLVPQQLRFVLQASPSALQGAASAARGITPKARTPSANAHRLRSEALRGVTSWFDWENIGSIVLSFF